MLTWFLAGTRTVVGAGEIKYGEIPQGTHQQTKNMTMRFYRFRPNNEKNCIRIKSSVNYNTLEIIGMNSPLILENNFKIARGKKNFDIIPFDDSLNFAISKRVKELLEINKVSGWNCFSIMIEGVNDEYYAFQNLSIAGPILNLDAVNNYETDFRKFDIKTWDGSDIFNLTNTLINCCVERVKDIFEINKVSNIEIQYL